MRRKWSCITSGDQPIKSLDPSLRISDYWFHDHRRASSKCSTASSRNRSSLERESNSSTIPEHPPRSSPFSSDWPVRLLLITSSIVCYCNSYEGDFVFDDSEAIVRNEDVTDLNAPTWRLWTNDFWGTPLVSSTSHKSWRPLTTWTFRLNHAYFGLDPRSYHVVNILLHCLVVLLSFEFYQSILSRCNNSQSSNNENACGQKLTGDSNVWFKTSTVASLLFSVHPVHTECVSSIVGRAELLSAAFFLTSFLLYTRAASEWRRPSMACGYTCLSVVCAFAAMLSKEQGITVLGLCVIYDTLILSKSILIRFAENLERRRGDQRNNNTEKCVALKDPELTAYITRISAAAVCGSAFLLIRLCVMDFTAPRFTKVDNPASFHENIWVRMINYNYQYALNAWLLLSPTWLCFDYSMGCIPLIDRFLDYRLLIVIAFWSAVAFLVRSSIWHKNEFLRRTVQIALLIIGLTFLPVSNLPFRVGFVLAERVLYLPSLGYCLLIGLAIDRAYRKLNQEHKTIFRWTYVGLVLIFALKSIQRSRQWTNEFDLFTSGVSVCPLNAKAHYNVGIVHGQRGQSHLAEEAYRNAISLNPDYDQAMNNLGNLLKESGRYSEAEELFARAIRIRHDFPAAWMNLGIVQAALKKFNESERSYETALKMRKMQCSDCFFNLGNLYVEQGRIEEARRNWRSALDLKPDHARAYINLMILYDNEERCKDAIEIGRRALRSVRSSDLSSCSLHFTMANCMGKLEMYEEAEQHYRRALEMSPKDSNYWANLAVLYHRWKRYDQAETAYRTALSLDPSSVSIRKNYQLLKRALQ